MGGCTLPGPLTLPPAQHLQLLLPREAAAVVLSVVTGLGDKVHRPQTAGGLGGGQGWNQGNGCSGARVVWARRGGGVKLEAGATQLKACCLALQLQSNCEGSDLRQETSPRRASRLPIDLGPAAT